MTHLSQSPKAKARSTRSRNSRPRFIPKIGLFAALSLVPLQDANAKSDGDSGSGKKDEKTPWYNKKVSIPKSGNTQISVRLASFYSYFHNNYNNLLGDDKYSWFANRLTFRSATRFKKGRRLTLTTRMDTQNMWENDLKNRKGRLCGIKSGPDVSAKSLATCDFGNDYRLERLTLEYSSRRIGLTLGDFNVNLGRAMGLSIRRISELGVDAAIKGIMLKYKSKRVETKVLAGFANRQNSDIATRARMADPGYLAHWCKNQGWNKADRYGNSLWSICSDFVAGGRVDIKKLPGKTKLGIHHASIFFGGYGQDAPDEGEPAQGKRIHLTGMDITPGKIGGKWDTFLGGALAIARHPSSVTPQLRKYNGVALYNSNNISFGNWNALIEAKYYDRYLIAYDVDGRKVQYAELATLERFDQWLPGAASTVGGRVKLDYFVGDTGWDIYINSMAYAFAVKPFGEHQGIFDKEGGALAVHTFGGFEYHKHHSPFTLNLAVGYRSETKNKLNEHNGKRDNLRSLPHLDLYTKIPLSSKGRFQHTLQITSFNWFELNGAQNKEGEYLKTFARGNLVVEYTMAPIMALSFIGGYTTENPVEPNTLALDPSKVCTKEEAKSPGKCRPQIYPGVSARFNFLGRSYLELFAGKRLGGLVCVNGSCRNLPDFVGADARLVMSF